MPTLSSLAALQVVIMTTCSAASDKKVGIMTTPSFQCMAWFPFLLWLHTMFLVNTSFIYPHSRVLLHWHWSNHATLVPVKLPWRIWVKPIDSLIPNQLWPMHIFCRIYFIRGTEVTVTRLFFYHFLRGIFQWTPKWVTGAKSSRINLALKQWGPKVCHLNIFWPIHFE